MNPCFLLLTVLITHGSLRSPQVTSWKSDSALVFLHRSAGMVAPENTVPAFEAAVRQGADGVETDIRRTRDGVLVIYHDDWVLRQRGPSGKIEDMTLAETQKLDVGERFGPQWRGIRLPLFIDLLEFAKANDLKLYLDIKTQGIYEEVMRKVREHGCLQLVHATGGQVPSDNYHLAIPWISGWNYTEGGEEDPDKMRDVISHAPKGVYGIMCDDARAIVRALGRNPEARSFVPFVSTMQTHLRYVTVKNEHKDSVTNFTAGLLHTDPKERRRACIALSIKPQRPALDQLLALAENDPDYTVRQEACWALGSLKEDRAVPTLLRIAKTTFDPKTAAQTDYRDTFLKIAGACALARLNSDAGRAALRTLMESRGELDRGAASAGIAAFGTEKDLQLFGELVDSRKENDGFAAGLAIGYAGRFGTKAIPIFVTGLGRNDTAKASVFGLAGLGEDAIPALRKLIDDVSIAAVVRHRANLALDWIRIKESRRINSLAR